MPINAAQRRKQLLSSGYCVVPDVLDQKSLGALRQRFSDAALSKAAKTNFGEAGAFIVADYTDPVLVDLLTWPKTLDILAGLGYPHPKLHNYYVSTKPPGAQALPWHSDLFYTYEKAEPAELFLIYYLQDTTRENGCLRVVPGSHLWRHDDHNHSHVHDTKARPGEVDVSIHAGELFIGDRRLLHATHANTSKAWRTCLTIAYAPDFNALLEPIRALIVQNQCLPPRGWDKQSIKLDPRLRAILPIYNGTATPAPTG